MLFEVLHSDGRVVMHTEHTSCVPDADAIESMSAAGYKFKVDGKLVAKTKVPDAVKASGPSAPTPAAPKPQTALENKPKPISKPTQITEPKVQNTKTVKDTVDTKVATSNNSKPKLKKLFDLDSILGIK